MFKKFLPFVLAFSAYTAQSQNLPSVVSYTVDTLCDNSYQELFLTITIEDLDGDSTYFMSVTNNDTYLGSTFNVVPPATFAGETQRTFKVYGDAGFGMAPGFNTSSINIEVEGNGNNDGGNLDQDLNDMEVQGQITVTLDFGATTFCTSDNPVDMTPYGAPAGGMFQHGAVPPHPTTVDMQDFFDDPGDGIFYKYTDALGCSAETSAWPPVFEAPDVSVTPNTSTCGNADGSADAMIFGQAAPFNVFWTTGFNEIASSNSSVSNLSSGTYYINVYDQNQCHAQGIAQISDIDLIVTEAITAQTCPGDIDGEIDLTISGGTVDDIFWSNGATTEDLTGLAEGEYTVSIHTTGNCQAFKTYYVNGPAPLGIDINNIMGEDCVQGQFSSLIDITTTGGSGSYSWDWDSGTNTMEDFTDPGVGPHNCVVTDLISGCTYDWDVDVPDYGAPYLWITNIVKPSCNQSDGSIDAQVSVNVAPIASIVWSSGPTTEDLVDVGAGVYTVTVTDDNGCHTSQTVELVNELPYQPSLCLLTVDSTYTYNQVIWEKDITQTIDGFNVYRETNSQGIFELVAQRPYALESQFMDNASSPMDRSWRYYLTTYDGCGNESYPSFIHKTIHTVAVDVGGGDYDVSWDKYEGISYTDVDLWRYDDVNGTQFVQNFLPSQLSHTDTPPATGNLEYFVSFNLTDACSTTKAQDYNSSRSNRTGANYNPGESTLKLDDEDLGIVRIYPNPTEGILNLFIENPSQFEEILVTDLNGRIVSRSVVSSSTQTLDLNHLTNGIYMVRLNSPTETIVEKIVKN